jgi:hypothetical protein
MSEHVSSCLINSAKFNERLPIRAVQPQPQLLCMIPNNKATCGILRVLAGKNTCRDSTWLKISCHHKRCQKKPRSFENLNLCLFTREMQCSRGSTFCFVVVVVVVVAAGVDALLNYC